MGNLSIKQIINKLQPYVNGNLITPVFIKYWEELKERIEFLQFQIDDYMRGDL